MFLARLKGTRWAAKSEEETESDAENVQKDPELLVSSSE